MRRLRTMALLLLSCAAPLTGCGHRIDPPAPVVVTEVKLVRERIPDALLRLRPEPVPPTTNSQKVVTVYMIEAVGALRACYATVEQIRAWNAAGP